MTEPGWLAGGRILPGAPSGINGALIGAKAVSKQEVFRRNSRMRSGPPNTQYRGVNFLKKVLWFP